MPETIKREDGTEVTVYSADELAAASKAEADKAVAAATAPIAADLEKAKADLAKLNEKDFNFGTLRTKVEELEGKQATAKADALAEFEANSRNRMAEQAVKSLADGDEELEKKIQFHLKKLSVEVKTEEDMKKAVRDAFVLARQDEKGLDPTAGAFGSGGAAPLTPRPASQSALSDNQKAFLRVAYPDLTEEAIKDLESKAKPPRIGSPDGNFGKIVV